MAVEIAPRRITITEFENMLRKRIFGEDDRIELINGEILDMSPIELPHMVCVSRLTLWFTKRFEGKAFVWAQNAIHLPNNTRPQPDLVLLDWRDDLYAVKHPTPEDVLLLVEVAESSLTYDRKIKGPIYAAAGIKEYWIIILSKSIVEVYSNSKDGRYETVHQAHRGDSLPLPSPLEGTLSVDDIFG